MLPRSLRQSFRKNTLMVGAGWRGFFAPFDIASAAATAETMVGPTLLDLSTGPFDVGGVLPLGFIDTGWIRDFALTPQSKIGQIRSGYRGAIRAQYRGEVGEQFEFKFREYGRLQYKLASGTNVMNILASAVGSTTGPLSAAGDAAVAITAYDPLTATATFAAAPPATINVNDFIVLDIDYDPATYGIVGDAGTPIFRNAVTDVDYIRRNSDYVARVTAKTATTLTFDHAFIGGGSLGKTAPTAASKIQKILGWCAREGGTFISEWTALFLLDTLDSAQIAVLYPHVSILQNRQVAATWAIENIGTTDETAYEMDAQFNALAFDDPLDGETVVGYKCYYPKPGQDAAA